jgi:hypothetical protein
MNLLLLNLVTSLILAAIGGTASGPMQAASSARPVVCEHSASPGDQSALVWRSVRHVYGCGCIAQYRVLPGHTNTLKCVCCKEYFRVNL